MRVYIAKFKVLSSLITPLQSDTIWGYIAWACFHIWGEKREKDFIKEHENGNPTLVSNAFPDGFIPVPAIPAKSKSGDTREDFKKVKKKNYIKIENFNKIKDNLTWETLFEVLKSEIYEDEKSKAKTTAVLRNKIDRFSFTTTGTGELFATKETFIPDYKMWFAIKTNYFNRAELKQILRYIELNGFGADASVGRGKFKFIELNKFELPESSDGNAFVTLSNFIPEDSEWSNFEDASYKIFTKYPKVGGHFALYQPFKKPIVFFEAGSVFKVGKFKNFYGKLIHNIHTNPEIVQYAYAFPIKVKMGDQK